MQAFQYWLKLSALAVPALVLLAVSCSAPDRDGTPPPPVFTDATSVDVSTPVTLQVAAPIDIGVRGEVDGATVNGPVSWAPGLHTVDAGTTLSFPAGAAVPVVTDADPDAARGPPR